MLMLHFLCKIRDMELIVSQTYYLLVKIYDFSDS